MITIPSFYDDRIKFVKFIKENNDIFYQLLESGKYNLTRKLNKNYIYEGYYFFTNFELSDDAILSSLIDDLDDFNEEGKPDIEPIIDEFEIWLHLDIVKEKFEKEYNKKIEKELTKQKDKFKNILDNIKEIRVKKRTMKRTSKIKDELLDIDYFPENRETSVKGKLYRRVRDSFNKKKNVGGKKKNTKKYRKPRV